jgi:hypothetical protein
MSPPSTLYSGTQDASGPQWKPFSLFCPGRVWHNKNGEWTPNSNIPIPHQAWGSVPEEHSVWQNCNWQDQGLVQNVEHSADSRHILAGDPK